MVTTLLQIIEAIDLGTLSIIEMSKSSLIFVYIFLIKTEQFEDATTELGRGKTGHGSTKTELEGLIAAVTEQPIIVS